MAISEERRKAFIARGGTGRATCDYCRFVLERDTPALATEYHHIITKSATMNNEKARELADSRYLCACLCADCHRGSHDVHNPEASYELLRHNMHLFGESTLIETYQDMEAALGRPLAVELPDYR